MIHTAGSVLGQSFYDRLVELHFGLAYANKRLKERQNFAERITAVNLPLS